MLPHILNKNLIRVNEDLISIYYIIIIPRRLVVKSHQLSEYDLIYGILIVISWCYHVIALLSTLIQHKYLRK